MNLSTPCTCGHGAGCHTYTTRGLGRCLAGPHDKRCTCDTFKEKK